MTALGQCAVCGMESLETGTDGFGPLSRCHLCGWREDTPGIPQVHRSQPPRTEEFGPVSRVRLMVAISGQPCSRTKEIGRLVARRLGTDYLDRLVLQRVARQLNATVEAVEARERRPLSWKDRLAGLADRIFVRAPFDGWSGDPGYLPGMAGELFYVPGDLRAGPKTHAYEIGAGELVAAVSRELHDLAGRGEAVIVHMAACAVFRREADVFKVGVFAPAEFRVSELLSGHGINEVGAARRELERLDRARAALIQRGLGVDPDHASLFDISVNSQTLTVEEAVEQIVAAVRSRSERRRGGLHQAARHASGYAVHYLRPPTGITDSVAEVPLESLAAVDIFRALPAFHVREIAAMGSVVHYPAGSVLAAEATAGEVVYAVLEGQVELSAESEVGRVTVRVAGKGETFPLAAIIGTGKIITRAEAMTDLRLWRVRRDIFRGFLKARPEVGLPVYDAAARVMADRYRDTLSRLTRAAERALTSSLPRVSV